MTRTTDIRLALIATLALASLAGATAPAGAAFPGSNGLVAFTSDRDGNFDIYTMAPDGSAQTRVTSTVERDSSAAWSPDGNRIAFMRRASADPLQVDIYTVAASGSDERRLTSTAGHDADPAWSPDGFRIAFTSDRDGDGEIYTMAPDGSAQTRLTNDATHEFEPVWSPDGTRIAFTSDRDGNPEIYTMASDGSAQTRLTSNLAVDLQPTWSPDGSRIAFTSDRDGDIEIYTMAPDGSAQTRLTSNSVHDVTPVWSPDGTRVAFASDRDGTPEIYTMALDGSGVMRLTNNVVLDYEPDWQPVAPTLASQPVPPAGATTAPPSGGTSPRPSRPPVVAAPSISGLSLTRSVFCVGRNCPRARRGTVLRFALSAPARVELAFERRATGRRADGRCGRAARSNRGGRRCIYYAKAGSFSAPGVTGANSVRLSGRINGRALRRGSYRLAVTAIGSNGARSSTTQRIRFRVSAPRPPSIKSFRG